MTAGRLHLFASTILAAAGGLLAVIFLPGCGVYRDYVRRGAMLDSLSIRLARLEREQEKQKEALNRLGADVLTNLEQLDNRIDEVGSEVQDLGERIDRIGRKIGAWRGEVETSPAVESGGADPGAPSPREPVRGDTLTPTVDADQMYNTAYLDFTRGNYQVAIVGFRRFIKLFPSSELADNAQYWVGECFYSLNQLDSAEVEFKKVVSEYPEGNKVPATIYKLGMIYQLQGKMALAQEKFKEVVKKYPGSPEAKLAQERLSRSP